MINPKSKYYQIPNNSQIPNSNLNFWILKLGFFAIIIGESARYVAEFGSIGII